MRLYWICLAVLTMAFGVSVAAQDNSSTIPTPLYPSYQSSAIVATIDQTNSQSALQNSALAHQNSADEALKKVAHQTSPAHEFGWNWAATICTILLIGVVLTPFVFERRPLETDDRRPAEIRRVA